MDFIVNKQEGFFNGRLKYVPDGKGGIKLSEIMIMEEAVFNPDGLEKVGLHERSTIERITGESQARSAQRASRKFRDIVECSTNLVWFVTLTLSPDAMAERCTTRYDYEGIVRVFRPWLSNHVQRHGLSYVLVPERHKDGAIHMHGFFNDVPELGFSENDRGLTTKSGNMIYNISGYPYGFSTACYISGQEDREKSARYCAKYCTKNTECIGGRYYFSGGELGRPTYKYFNYEYDDALGDVYQVEGMSMKYTRAENPRYELTVLGLLNHNKIPDGVVDRELELLWSNYE